jgi:hypothetical protein
LVKKNTGDRLELRISTRATNLRKMGKTTLLKEMPPLIVLPSCHSCHQSNVAKTARKRAQVQPMGSGDILHDAM